MMKSNWIKVENPFLIRINSINVMKITELVVYDLKYATSCFFFAVFLTDANSSHPAQ